LWVASQQQHPFGLSKEILIVKVKNMTTDSPSGKSENSKQFNTLLLTSIVLIIFGIVAIILPNVSTIVAETWISIILVFSSVTKLVYAFQSRHEGGFIWKLLLSVLYIATGVYLFVYPLAGVLTLTLLLGSFLLTEGGFELFLAFRLRPQQNWIWVLADGIITLLLGGLVWFQWPSDASWVIGTVVGISILSTGVSRLMLSLKPASTLEQSGSPVSS
jgi:uncharacterized membrane protein HdeD (DUF308 family)